MSSLALSFRNDTTPSAMTVSGSFGRVAAAVVWGFCIGIRIGRSIAGRFGLSQEIEPALGVFVDAFVLGRVEEMEQAVGRRLVHAGRSREVFERRFLDLFQA